jgi:hypothetical protein
LITFKGGAGATPATIVTAAFVPTPTVTGGAVVTPATIAALAAVPVPLITNIIALGWLEPATMYGWLQPETDKEHGDIGRQVGTLNP